MIEHLFFTSVFCVLYYDKTVGLENRVGSIEVGKDADIVIYDNDPLHYMTKVVTTIVNGVVAYKL